MEPTSSGPKNDAMAYHLVPNDPTVKKDDPKLKVSFITMGGSAPLEDEEEERPVDRHYLGMDGNETAYMAAQKAKERGYMQKIREADDEQVSEGRPGPGPQRWAPVVGTGGAST